MGGRGAGNAANFIHPCTAVYSDLKTAVKRLLSLRQALKYFR